MTFINIFPNFNTDYFAGMSWNFMPSFSCFTMPSFFNFNSNFNTFIPNFTFPLFDFSSIWNSPPSFNMPVWGGFNSSFNSFQDFNFNNSSFSNIWENSSAAKSRSSTSVGDSISLSNKHKTGFFVKNYDANAGERLAKIALNNQVGFTNKCATYVKKAIQQSGLGSYEYGHGYQMAGILRKNSNFKEISPSSVNVKDLPAGCVLVYGRGVGGYSSAYGHTEITTGDGRAVSDGITKNLRKTPSAIFVPVSA